MHKTIFVWIDLEMTGLNPQKDTILEIATIITDEQLNILEQGPHLIIHQPTAILNTMSPTVKTMHTNSGLIEAVHRSSISMQEAENATLAHIKKYAEHKEAYLAGNSVWQDKAFLQKYMPLITEYLHYRILDVTAFKVAINAWYPEKNESLYHKKDCHRALDDIKESIEELKHYKNTYLIKKFA